MTKQEIESAITYLTRLQGAMHPEYQPADHAALDVALAALQFARKGEVLERARTWWFETMASRVIPGDNTRTVIVQPLHDRDLAGLAAEHGYTVLSIPMELKGGAEVIEEARQLARAEATLESEAEIARLREVIQHMEAQEIGSAMDCASHERAARAEEQAITKLESRSEILSLKIEIAALKAKLNTLSEVTTRGSEIVSLETLIKSNSGRGE